MNNVEYKKNAEDMIYLIVCAVKNKIPDLARIERMHLDNLFQVCQKHILTACVAYALEAAGIYHHQFQQAKEKAIRKNILFDAERKKILNRLEQEKIWYMPLKGAILKDWYPKLGMRQMSDNDILCDPSCRLKVKEIMLDMGFICNHFGIANDDSYFMPPVCNFEMHDELFTIAYRSTGNIYEYYQNIKEKLIKDENNQYGYHFKTEDFYLYLTAHEFKHFSDGGTGIRALVDIYIFIKKFENSIDWNYIQKESKKIGISDYEQKCRILTEKLFQNKELTQEEEQLLDYFIFSGVYGTIENQMNHRFDKIENDSKAKYLFHRVFPSMDEIETYWNFFYRHKWLIPVLWVYRPIRALFIKKERVYEEIKCLKRK